MASYPPLRLPGGEYYQPEEGTQYVQADGRIYKPRTQPAPQPAQPRAQSAQPIAAPSLTSTSTRDAGAVVVDLFPQKSTISLTPNSATTAPALTAPAGKSLAGRVGTQLADAGKGLGQSIAKNPMGAANVALGLAGVLQYATAKAPKLPGRPETYAPVIRPAQGLNSASLEAGRAGIQATQRQVSRPQTSDAATGAVTRLVAQQQAAEAQNQLTLKDSEAYERDQARVDQQTAQAYDANYKTQRSYEEKKFDVQQRGYEARRQQGTAMAQNALTYITQQQGAKRQAEELKLESQNRQAESRNALLATQLRGETDPTRRRALADQMLKNDPNAGSTVKALAPDLLAKGGKIGAARPRAKSSIRPLPNSVDSHHEATRQFGEQMQRITQAAMRAFQQTLLSASQKRAKGFRS